MFSEKPSQSFLRIKEKINISKMTLIFILSVCIGTAFSLCLLVIILHYFKSGLGFILANSG